MTGGQRRQVDAELVRLEDELKVQQQKNKFLIDQIAKMDHMADVFDATVAGRTIARLIPAADRQPRAHVRRAPEA